MYDFTGGNGIDAQVSLVFFLNNLLLNVVQLVNQFSWAQFWIKIPSMVSSLYLFEIIRNCLVSEDVFIKMDIVVCY